MSVRKALAIVALVPCLALGAEWNITPGHWSWKAGVDNVDALPGSGNLVNDVRVAGCVDAVGECSPTLWIWTSDEEWSQIVGEGGGSAFADITSGTNTTAAMVVGSGSSISLTGTGTVEATSLLTPSAAAYVGGLGLDFRSTDLANSLGTLGFLSAGLLGTNAEEVRFDSNSDVTIRPNDTSGKSADLLVSAANNTSSGAGGALILRGGTSVSGTAGITILQGCSQYGARSSAPSSPTPAECGTYYNTTSDKLCTYNGSVWVCGGAPTFDEIDSGANTTAAMVVGTGASLSATGSGTIAATTSAALAANAANCSAGQAAAGVDASGAAEGCAAYLADITGETIGDLSDVDETGASTGEALVSDGAGAWAPSAAAVCLEDGTNCPSPGSGTAGVIQLSDGSGGLSGDAGFVWDSVNNELELAHGSRIVIPSTTSYMRFYQGASHLASLSGTVTGNPGFCMVDSGFEYVCMKPNRPNAGGTNVAFAPNSAGDSDSGFGYEMTTGSPTVIDDGVQVARFHGINGATFSGALSASNLVATGYLQAGSCRLYGSQSSPPSSPSACWQYYDSDSNTQCIYDGTVWQPAYGAGSCS